MDLQLQYERVLSALQIGPYLRVADVVLLIHTGATRTNTQCTGHKGGPCGGGMKRSHGGDHSVVAGNMMPNLL